MNDNGTRYDTVKNLYNVYDTDKPGYNTITNLYGVDTKKDLFEELDKDPELTYSDLYLIAGDLESAVKAFDFLLKKHEMTKDDLKEYIKYKRRQLGIDNKENEISDNKEKVDSTEKSDIKENSKKDNGVEEKPKTEAVDDSKLQNLNDLIKDDPLNNLTLDVNRKRNNLVKNKSQSMSSTETKNDNMNDYDELLAMFDEYQKELKEIEEKIDKISNDSNISDFVKQVKLENYKIRQAGIAQCINVCLEAARKIKGSLNNNELNDSKVKGKVNFEPSGAKNHKLKEFYADEVPEKSVTRERLEEIKVDKEGKTIADSINNSNIVYHRIPLTLEELKENGGTEPEDSKKVRLIDRLRDLKMVRKIKSAIDFIRERTFKNKKQLSRDTAELSEEQAEAIAMESARASVEDDRIEIPAVNVDLQSIEESAKSR